VGDLVEVAFRRVDLDWEDHVRSDRSLQRGRAELHNLVGDTTKAKEELGWGPTLDFESLVQLLVDTDLEQLRLSLARARA
jgi:GDPmannose 4,6-dehydratase